MCDEEYDYKREKALIQAEIDFKHDEEFGELFRKEAKIVLSIEEKSVNLQDDKTRTFT